MVGVRGDEHVRAHVVEHREVVDRERAGAAGADLAVVLAAAVEALETVRQRRGPHVGEPRLDGAARVRVDGEVLADRSGWAPP